MGLAADPSYWVREEVAGNERTPVSVLKLLAEDSDLATRRQVALNPNAPGETLWRIDLSQDQGARAPSD